MKVAILAGGMGTRLAEVTQVRPKPMVEIGPRPILWHIMKIYAHHGHDEFVVALGYMGDFIKDYFLDYASLAGNLSVDLASGTVTRHAAEIEPWKVHLWDTGPNTQTGGRVKRLREVIGDETFLLTYGDGVGDVDLHALVEHHRAQGKICTLTAVRPPARYGSLELRGGGVMEFSEKEPAKESWVNGGFMVAEPAIFDWIEGDDTTLEKGVLEKLAAAGELAAYEHHGFWQSMDTLRDRQLLERLWAGGDAPWKVWA